MTKWASRRQKQQINPRGEEGWKKKMKRIFIFLILLFSTSFLYGQEVVATTSVLSSVIEDITDNKIQVVTLVPSGNCPGHFDLKISHLALIEKSGLLFAQGYEDYLAKIKDSIRNPNFKLFTIEVQGSWLVPEVEIKVYDKIFSCLSELFPENKTFFVSNKKKIEKEIKNMDKAVSKMIKNKKMKGLPVICNSHLKDFLEYLGFKVVAVYGRKEELTVSNIKNLIEVSKKNKVVAVIDNIQAGADTGEVVAKYLNILHLTISNYPNVLPNTPTLRQTLYENVKKIIIGYETFNKTL